MSVKKLAINGGEAAFAPSLPLIYPVFHNFENYIEQFSQIYSTGMLTKGKNLDILEKKLEKYIGVKNVIAVSSGTMGIVATLSVLGIKPGDEIILPSFTFCATAHAAAFLGAKIIFADCNISDFTLSVSDVKKKITNKTKAIIGVHIFGALADVEGLKKLADKNNIYLLFDAAHGMGSEFKNVKAGNFGIAEIFSCSPTKTFITGEGGLIATNDDELAQKLRIFREYGNPGNYNCVMVGLNARMNEVSALTGLMSFDELDNNLRKRKSIASQYILSLGKIDGIRFQEINNNVVSNYKDFAIIIDERIFGINRDKLAVILDKEGIPTRKYFYPPVHKMDSYINYKDDILPGTTEISNNVLCLPIFPEMSKFQIEKITDVILLVHKEAVMKGL